MAYCTVTDVELAAGGSERLVELADVEDDGALNFTALAAAIASSDAWIDSYLQRRHAVPLASVPERVKRFSAQETIYVLKQARNAVTDEDKEQHDERREWLVDVSKGVASVGVDPAPTKSTAIVPEVLERSSDEAISRASLENW